MADRVCGNCATALSDGAAFCGRCGAPALGSRRCARCYAPLAVGDGFCSRCGTPWTAPGLVPTADTAGLTELAAQQKKQATAVQGLLGCVAAVGFGLLAYFLFRLAWFFLTLSHG